MACEGPLFQTSLRMAQLRKLLQVGGEAENGTFMWGEWPRVRLNSFYVVLDRFLEHPAPFKFFWRIDSGFQLHHLEVGKFLDLFCVWDMTKKNRCKFQGGL